MAVGKRMVDSVERRRVEHSCHEVEAELRSVGGDDLVVDARTEAEWYAALYYGWDGRGEEPLIRVRARMTILSLRLDRQHSPDSEAP